MFVKQGSPAYTPPRPVICRVWPVMSVVLYVLFDLVRSSKSLSSPACTRVFAAVDGAVIVLRNRVTVFGLGMPIKGLLLGKGILTTFRLAFVRLFVSVSVFAIITLVMLHDIVRAGLTLV